MFKGVWKKLTGEIVWTSATQISIYAWKGTKYLNRIEILPGGYSLHIYCLSALHVQYFYSFLVVKPGVCNYGIGQICVKVKPSAVCASDEDCPGEDKCCKTACGVKLCRASVKSYGKINTLLNYIVLLWKLYVIRVSFCYRVRGYNNS